MSNPRFIWYELVTSDVEAAKAFYTKIVNWGTEPFEGGTTPYTVWTVQGKGVGGVLTMPHEVKGAPPHWLGYVSCPNVDEASKQVVSLGGKVHRPPADIPTVGRFCVVADPQGAAFVLFTPNSDAPAPTSERHQPGTFGWSELNTTDWEGAWKFYSTLFGWKETSRMDMGNDFGTYFMFTDRGGGDESMGGMSNAAKMMGAPPHWLYYVNVPDIDRAVAAVKEHGGKVLNGPMDVPGNGKIAQCTDPQGGFFAVYYQG
jgi:predicted enzyme related to lactoylglutathione lyase